MSAPKDGGLAFPTSHVPISDATGRPQTIAPVTQGGMSLRMWLAGQALAGIMANPNLVGDNAILMRTEHGVQWRGILAREAADQVLNELMP